MDQRHDGTHFIFASQAATAAKSHQIRCAIGIICGGPGRHSKKAHRYCIFFSANNPCGIHDRVSPQGALHVARSSTRCIHGVMIPIPPYNYLSKGHMIQIKFLSLQLEHPEIVCYITACGCFVVPGIVELKYIVQI